MPYAPKRPCPGCGALSNGLCPSCKSKTRKVENAGRASSNERGYTWRWRQYSKRFVRENPLCAMCLAKGETEASAMTDHITPVSGPDDPLFWDPANHQALSWSCHSIKTNTEDGGFGNPKRPQS